MNRSDLEAHLTSRGWTKDRHGHFHKTKTDGSRYRFKLSKIAARYEARCDTTPPSWVRLRSGYYSKLSITTDGKIAGLTR